ncbi:MAG: carbohydrate binding domain-containing protein [Phycisphaerales bacterium]|nr:MAG: carbohydrate binding domain-containing protein [Phycisphaerales bacterium]
MRARGMWSLMALAMGFAALGVTQAQEVENLLDNGGFESGKTDAWNTYSATMEVVERPVGVNVLEDPVEGQYCLHVTVDSPGTNNWGNDLEHGGHVFEQNKKYTLSAWMKCAEGTLDIRFKPELGVDRWTRRLPSGRSSPAVGSRCRWSTTIWTRPSTRRPSAISVGPTGR